ncbi:MAG: hypothetical protein M1819_003898 [Sarea resinae]|nr:MAG: hypothetical protein M1819_003898 [Sarea resinae]
MNEHAALAKKVKRLEEQLETEKIDREQEIKDVYRAVENVYHNFGLLQSSAAGRLLEFDDKLEGLVDKMQGYSQELKNTKEKVANTDDATMDLELRVEELEEESLEPSKSLLNGTAKDDVVDDHDHPNGAIMPQPAAVVEFDVVFVPFMGQPWSFEIGAVADRRCQSRGLRRHMSLTGTNNRSVIARIEATFRDFFNGRRWVPLVVQSYAPDDVRGRSILNRLTDDTCCSDLWDVSFLQKHCVSVCEGISTMYLTLRDRDISWDEIRRLPPVEDFDQSCWDYFQELDGRLEEDEGLDVGPSESDTSSQNKISEYPDPVDRQSPLELLASLAPMPMKRQISLLDRNMTAEEQSSRKAKRRRKPLE